MLETLGTVTGSPWIFGIIAASVVLDVFLPLLPSGVLVITAATAVAGTTAADAADLPSRAGRAAEAHHLAGPVGMLALVLCATAASVLGDVVAYRLARRGGDRFGRAISRSRRLSTAQQRLGQALTRGGGVLVVLARFAPAGRSVVSLMAGTAHRRAKEFVPWSALAGLAWAAYSVSLGYFGSRWLGASWLGTAVSVLALVVAGSVAAYFLRRTPAPEPAGLTDAPESVPPVVPAELPAPRPAP
ncbi:VTT domain-containing protein [Streptomyces sp. HNM0574]|uniref:VTT domain-containing protein n=1 Tax=Streptomyces sp. HNM0574 TaxID=2714954 RepID=UPI00146A0F0A|nr:hypothetical protein [Streptomyces sp. HNM0574]